MFTVIARCEGFQFGTQTSSKQARKKRLVASRVFMFLRPACSETSRATLTRSTVRSGSSSSKNQSMKMGLRIWRKIETKWVFIQSKKIITQIRIGNHLLLFYCRIKIANRRIFCCQKNVLYLSVRVYASSANKQLVKAAFNRQQRSMSEKTSYSRKRESQNAADAHQIRFHVANAENTHIYGLLEAKSRCRRCSRLSTKRSRGLITILSAHCHMDCLVTFQRRGFL